MLPESMRRYLSRYFSLGYLDSLEAALKTPASRYFLRVNSLKANPADVVSVMREEGYEVYQHSIVREAIYTLVKGPNTVAVHRGRVIVDWKTAESAYVGANIYAPGVQKVMNCEKGDFVTVFSPAGVPVAEGVLEMTPKEIFSERKGLAVRSTNSIYRVPSFREHPFYRAGVLYAQSFPSMAAVKALPLREDWTVLDMCASPGGKATHAAEIMKDKGEVIAVDRSEKKVREIEENARRLGLRSIKPLVYDSRYISDVVDSNSIDVVILDPPCTTLGIRPKLIYTRGEKDVYQSAEYQRQFLSEAYKVLRRSGILLYTTCTLTPHENELNIIYAVSEIGFKALPLSLPFSLRSPLLGVDGGVFDPVVSDTPGFFISMLVKR
ncbi:MAG: RsmB/NOP family class I SAM-dependent RNA methyltransferase [Infirmifilum sp.]